MGRRIAWFSCGAASAAAAKLSIDKYGQEGVKVVYCDTMANEHPDNQRFFDDVQSWLGVPIERIKSSKYATIEEVFDSRRYMSGIAGAPCTVELKKVPRFAFQEPDDIHIFGYTVEEERRIERFANNNFDLNLEWILRDNGFRKEDCLDMISEAGIEIPMMYKLGYRNNNCIGCVKASSVKYWNQVRREFPEVWLRRVEQSRNIGAKLAKYRGTRVFLDEVPPDFDDGILENISCGPECADGNGVEV